MGFVKDFTENLADHTIEFVDGLTRKAFIVYFDDIFTYPAEKDFIYPNNKIICEALEKYGADNNEEIGFISREKPITFWLNRKEKYEAVLELGLGRVQGYAVRCVQVKE